MEASTDTPLIINNSDTIEVIRKELNLHQPGRMEESIDRLDEWIKSQPHFNKKDYSRKYLEIFIITAKGSVEGAKGYIEKLCAFKTFGPQYFAYSTKAIDLTGLEKVNFFVLPRLTKENYRILFLHNTEQQEYTQKTILNFYIKLHMMLEYSLQYRTYTLGARVVLDYRKTELSHLLSTLKYHEARNGCMPFFKGYATRIKSVHFITESRTIYLLVTAISQIISPKMLGRIHVHTNIEQLYEHIDKDLLPSDYGGREKSITELRNDWDEALSTNEFMDYLKDMFQATINPTLKPNEKFDDLFVGMPGTFRSLSID